MTYRPLRLSDMMPFGKHQGQQIEDLIYDQPSYMAWVFNDSSCELDTEVTRVMEEQKII